MAMSENMSGRNDLANQSRNVPELMSQMDADLGPGSVAGGQGSVGERAGDAEAWDPMSQMDADLGGLEFDPGRLPDEARAFGLRLRSGYRSPARNRMTAHSSPTSYHILGTAYDFTGPAEGMKQFAKYVRNNYGPSLAELYHGQIGWKNGQPAKPILYRNNHVHVAWAGDGRQFPVLSFQFSAREGSGEGLGSDEDLNPISQMDQDLALEQGSEVGKQGSGEDKGEPEEDDQGSVDGEVPALAEMVRRAEGPDGSLELSLSGMRKQVVPRERMADEGHAATDTAQMMLDQAYDALSDD
jgi:hypothetical protein